ncbi:AbfB domain-containing protein [Archangium minus]
MELRHQLEALDLYNFPGNYLRHSNAEVWLAAGGADSGSNRTASLIEDASWDVTSAWAP